MYNKFSGGLKQNKGFDIILFWQVPLFYCRNNNKKKKKKKENEKNIKKQKEFLILL